MNLDILELFQVIGQKEVAIFLLTKEKAALQAEIERLTRVAAMSDNGHKQEVHEPAPAAS